MERTVIGIRHCCVAGRCLTFCFALRHRRRQGRRELRGRVLSGDQGRVPAVRWQVDADAQALFADQPALLEGWHGFPDEEGRAGDDQARRPDVGGLSGEVARSAVVARRRVVQRRWVRYTQRVLGTSVRVTTKVEKLVSCRPDRFLRIPCQCELAHKGGTTRNENYGICRPLGVDDRHPRSLRPCLIQPRKRTSTGARRMSAKCHEAT